MGMLPGQLEMKSNIVWQWYQIRQTLTGYSICVGHVSPENQSNIVWQRGRNMRTLIGY